MLGISDTLLIGLVGPIAVLLGTVFGHAIAARTRNRELEIEHEKAETAKDTADLDALRTVVEGLSKEVERLHSKIESMENKLRAAEEATTLWVRKYRSAIDWGRALHRVILDLMPYLKENTPHPTIPEPHERIRDDL